MKKKSIYPNKQLELNSLIEFSQLINSNLNLNFILGNILLSIMGKMMISKAFFLIKKNGEFLIKSQKGADNNLLDTELTFNLPPEPFFRLNDIVNSNDFFEKHKIHYFFKVYFSNKLIGLLCIGEKPNSVELTNQEIIFIETLLNISATTIENTLKFEEVTDLNKRLDIQFQQMKSLFELSKEFSTNFNNSEKIIKQLSYTLLGNFGIRDILIFTKFNNNNFYILNNEFNYYINKFNFDILEELKTPILLEKSLKNSLLEYLRQNKFKLLIPALNKSNDVESVVCLGERLSKQPFTKSDIEYLESLINISAISLDNTMLFNEYLGKQKMENEIKLAKEIQTLLLPQSFPEMKNYEISGKNSPAFNIGGDYFDFIKIDDSRIAIIIADVSGKGLPASLLMSNIQSAIHSFFRFNSSDNFNIAEITQKINSLIYENTSSEKFITFFWGIIDNSDNSFVFTNAGHNPPLLLKNSLIQDNDDDVKNSFILLNEGGLMLGIIEGIDYQFGKVYMDKDDVLVLYTDGITESHNEADEDYGEEKLKRIIIQNRKLNVRELLDKIMDDVDKYSRGLEQYDDETLIILKRLS